jgi:hypothetical protein
LPKVEKKAVHTPPKAGRTPVPDELYLAKLRELLDEAGGVVPSAREVAGRLSVGQARRAAVVRTEFQSCLLDCLVS